MKHQERVTAFVGEIWRWFSVHKRVLPWRDLEISDPAERGYRILVSEIMLQQTQVPRVIVTYRNFLERFPTLKDLAEASNKEVLIAWRGMGYNSRALRLRDAARTIVGDSSPRLLAHSLTRKSVHESKNQRISESAESFPTSMSDLLSIPGIGPYTAAAIRNFAFNLPTPCIDTNIRRILHRTFVGPEDSEGVFEKDDKYLLKIADEVLQEAVKFKSTADWHAALMDFGSLTQTKRNPRWDVCPLTARGIMKTTKKNYELRMMNHENARIVRMPRRGVHTEPGRYVGSVFIPNRIFRGRIIEALRDAQEGLTLHDIGAAISVDWNPGEHREWLETLLKKLQHEKFLELRAWRYALSS